MNLHISITDSSSKNSKVSLENIKITPTLECILRNIKQSFDGIAGNEYAKEIINETFILPSKVPKIFKGNVKPWQSILLYGVTFLPQLISYLASWSRKDYACLSCLLPQ